MWNMAWHHLPFSKFEKNVSVLHHICYSGLALFDKISREADFYSIAAEHVLAWCSFFSLFTCVTLCCWPIPLPLFATLSPPQSPLFFLSTLSLFHLHHLLCVVHLKPPSVLLFLPLSLSLNQSVIVSLCFPHLLLSPICSLLLFFSNTFVPFLQHLLLSTFTAALSVFALHLSQPNHLPPLPLHPFFLPSPLPAPFLCPHFSSLSFLSPSFISTPSLLFILFLFLFSHPTARQMDECLVGDI